MTRSATYTKGDVIILEGSHTSEVYALTRGSVEVYRQGPPERRLAVLCSPNIFGEMALITEQPRSASVRALEDIEVSILDCDEALDIWRTTPDALFAITRLLCEPIRAFNSLVTELAHHGSKIEEAVRAYLGADTDTLHASGPSATAKLHVTIEGLTPRRRHARVPPRSLHPPRSARPRRLRPQAAARAGPRGSLRLHQRTV